MHDVGKFVIRFWVCGGCVVIWIWYFGILGGLGDWGKLLELALMLVQGGEVEIATVISALMVLVFCWVWMSRQGVLLVDLPVFDKVMGFNLVFFIGLMMAGSILGFDVPVLVPWMASAAFANQIVRSWVRV